MTTDDGPESLAPQGAGERPLARTVCTRPRPNGPEAADAAPRSAEPEPVSPLLKRLDGLKRPA